MPWNSTRNAFYRRRAGGRKDTHLGPKESRACASNNNNKYLMNHQNENGKSIEIKEFPPNFVCLWQSFTLHSCVGVCKRGAKMPKTLSFLYWQSDNMKKVFYERETQLFSPRSLAIVIKLSSNSAPLSDFMRERRERVSLGVGGWGEKWSELTKA